MHLHRFHPYILRKPAWCTVFMANEMSNIDFHRGRCLFMITEVRKTLLLIYGFIMINQMLDEEISEDILVFRSAYSKISIKQWR